MGEYKKLRKKLKEILKQQKHYLSGKQIKELCALNFYYETAGGAGHPKLIYYKMAQSLFFQLVLPQVIKEDI